MTQTIKKLKIAVLILFLVEAAALIVAALFAYFNWFHASSFLTSFNIVLVGLVLLIVNALVYWFGIFSIGRRRKRNDLEAASIVSHDVQEAYTFGQVGIIVTDERHVVLYSSILFTSRNIDLIDTNIFDWQPTLKELLGGPVSKVVSITERGRNYEVRYLSERHLFVFRDTTAYTNLEKYSKDKALVLGIVQIDNYDDVASDTDRSAAYVTRVRTTIAEYFRNKGAILRTINADTYFSICNYESLKKMEDDKFSIIDLIHKESEGEENRLTISIGMAHNFDETAKLNDMASDALNVALSRGGDQVVVSHYGSELAFYGGKSTAIESTSKIKIRSFVDSMMTLISSASNVLIMGHTEADMDALGSNLGVLAICQHCGTPAKIIFNPKNAEVKTRSAFHGAFDKEWMASHVVDPSDAPGMIKDSTLLIVTDTSVPRLTMCPKALDKASKVIIIDHHRIGADFIEHPVLSMIDTSASSASELVAEMIHYATANPRIALEKTFATLMLAGIFLDSNYYKSKATGIGTFSASEILKHYGADNATANGYLKDELEEYQLISEIVSLTKYPQYGIAVCTVPDNQMNIRATLSKVADQIMQFKGTNGVFVIGRTDEKTVRISARSDGTVNVQLLCEKMSGGGHYTMAASAFMEKTTKEVEEIVKTVLDDYLEAARMVVSEERN